MSSNKHCDHTGALLWIAEFGDRPPLSWVATLLDQGYELTTVDSLTEACQRLKQEPVDAILLSVTGWHEQMSSVCQQLQEASGPQAPPIIAIALPSGRLNLAVALADGLYDYLLRTTPYLLLQQRLKNAVQYHRLQLEAQQWSQATEALKHHLSKTKHRLEQSQRQDEVTQLLNRSAFEEALQLAWRSHRREQRSLCLVLLELDYGAAAWDDVATAISTAYLRIVGQTILDHLKRPGDLACRYQERQLLLLLPGTKSQGASQLLKSLETSLKLELEISHQLKTDLQPCWYRGIACQQPQAEQALDELLRQVKQALIEDKDNAASHSPGTIETITRVA